MKSRKLFLVIGLIPVFMYAFVTDDTAIKTITLKLEKLRKNYPQEKLHLQFDKPYYSIGDTIYFKAYLVNAEKNTPSVTSNVLYVDLVNDKDSIESSVKLPVTDGVAWGTIHITDLLHEGNHRIRAYTNWMRNFDDAFFFDKVITIVNGFNNELMAIPSLQLGNSGSKNNDSVVIQYTSLDNSPAGDKKISFSVFVNNIEKAKGKGVTDANGRLTINVADMHAPKNQPVVVVAKIKLDDKTITKETAITIPATRHSIQFFPEGGQMVAGVPLNIGFKAMRADGFGTGISGLVNDDSTNEAIPIKFGFAGIGSFKFTPLPGHTYHAVIQYQDGSEETIALPAVQTTGYVLSANNSNKDSVTLNISSKQASDKVILVGQTNNRIHYSAWLDLTGGSTSVTLSKKKFPTGIMQFTVFDPSLHPVAERLVFNDHHYALQFHVSFDKAAYDKREKTTMQLSVKDEKGNPVSGSFSLAVTNAETMAANTDKQQTIFSNLLLTADIKGYVEDADYYFTGINETKIKALDDLLLTQGWRRFAWQDVLADKYPSLQFAKEKTLSINGKVITSKGEPVAGSQVILLPKKADAVIQDAVTDSSGNFMFDDLTFDDKNPFVLQASETKNEKKVEIRLADFHAPPATNNKNQPQMQQRLSYTLLPYIKQSQQQYDTKRKYGLLQEEHQLQDVVVTTAQKNLIKEAVAPSYNLNGPGNADQVLTYADLANCHELGFCLQGKITGVFFKMVLEDPASRDKVWHLKPFSVSGMGAPMMVILDGNDLGLTADMRNIPVHNIQSIEVLRTGGHLSAYGLKGSGGVLVITTKQGGIDYNGNTMPPKQPDKNIAFTMAKGYAAAREFYMPDYSDPAVKSASMPDMRSTVFWKPNITTNEDGKAVIDWYNADNTGDCNIIIQGLSAEGKMGYGVFNYKKTGQ